MPVGNFGKPVIIIPAYNEEKLIGRIIDLIKGTGVNADIIVVNDGSTDKTAEIAMSKGCKIVRLPKNSGKANAFFAGIKEALKTNPAAAVTLDADMVTIPKEGLGEMIAEAANASMQKRMKMIIAPQREGSSTGGWFSPSGIRAFSLPALYKLKSSKFKNIPKGFGLELFLNSLFEKEFTASWLAQRRYPGFVTERAFRRGDRGKGAEREANLTLKRIKRRMPK